jgi:peptidoglycan hydrolase-like protein with peptidoglycan-binding domain
MEDNQRALHTQIQKTHTMQGEMKSRLETVEVTTGSVAVRFEEVLNEQKRLSRRVDDAVEDKEKLLKKMSSLEEGLIQTQDTLRAKALVLLTDQAVADKTKAPKMPVYERASSSVDEKDDMRALQERVNNKTSRNTFKASEVSFGQEESHSFPLHSVPPKTSRFGAYAVAGSIVAILALGGGVIWNQMYKQEVMFNPVELVAAGNIDTPNTDPFEGVDMTALAPQMNAVEPGNVSNNVSGGIKNKLDVTSVNSVIDISKDIAASERQAINQLIRSVPQGNLQALIGVDSGLPKTVKEIETQALAGNASAQHDLAAIYTAGHGGTKVDFSKAAKWFEQAAIQDVANARYNLAVLYHQGLGVEKNEAYAIDLYKTAANSNHPEAQYNLGIAYIEGIGVSQDVAVATHYFEQAAKNNVMEAAYNLGLIHENGLMGQQRPDEAIFWYKVASSKGSPEGRQALELLSKKLELTPSDVNELISRISLLKPDVGLVSGASARTPAPMVAQATVSEDMNKNTKNSIEKKAVSNIVSVTNVAPGSDAVIVSQIQEQLINLGLYPGPADGVVGPVTEDAVTSYQSLNGLSQDGVASEDLLVHMLAREFELGTYPAAGVFEDVGSQE